ncbi:hypothetical protein ACFL3B_05925 [Gemmatimonadota bacterium]
MILPLTIRGRAELMRLPLIVVTMLLMWSPESILAQDPVVVIRPGEQEREIDRAATRAVRIFNRPSTTRIFGSFTVRRDDIYGGDVGVYGGSLVVSGIIEGDLVVINADARLRSSAEVHGDILVIGGRLDRSAGADVTGVTRRYRESVDIRRVGDEVELRPRRTEYRVVERERRLPYRSSTDASFALGFGPTYSRVEGLPIHFGPRLTWRNSWYSRLRGTTQLVGGTSTSLPSIVSSTDADTIARASTA